MASSGIASLQGDRYGHLPWRQRVITYSTLSTATLELTAAESGAFIFVPTVSTAKLSLPKISSLNLGVTYEVFVSTMDAANDFNIVSTNDSSAVIVGVLTSGAAGAQGQSIAPDTTRSEHYARLTAVSSIRWNLVTNSQTESSGAAVVGALVLGGWTTGTTA